MESNAEEEAFKLEMEMKRHEEITSLLTNIHDKISKDTDEELVKAISVQTKNISKVVETMKLLSENKSDDKPVINELAKINSSLQESQSNETTLRAIRDMANLIQQSQNEIKLLLEKQMVVLQHKKEWAFTVNRGQNGYIESIAAIQIK